MKKKGFIAVLTAALIAVGSAVFPAGAVAADATATVDFASAYVWRGITFNDGAVVQPSLDVSSGGLGINVWGNMDIDDYEDTLESGEFSEVDLTLSYGFSLEPVDVTAGYIEYLFPEGGAGTREVFAGLSVEPAAGFTAGIEGYYDFDEVEDYYVNLSLGYTREFDSGFTAGAGASAGIAGDDASAGEDSGLHEYMFSVNCSYPITGALEVNAFLAYTDTFDEDVLPDQDTDLFGAAGISWAF